MIERVERRPRLPKPTISILSACDDPALFGPAFRNPSTWAAWRAFLAALFGLPMTEPQLQTFRAFRAALPRLQAVPTRPGSSSVAAAARASRSPPSRSIWPQCGIGGSTFNGGRKRRSWWSRRIGSRRA